MWANTKTVPTVGRVILVALCDTVVAENDMDVSPAQPVRADVVYVNNADQTINVLLTDHSGRQYFFGDREGDALVVYDVPEGVEYGTPEFTDWAEGQFNKIDAEGGPRAFAFWMPYQQKMHAAQVKREATEALTLTDGKDV